MIAYEYLRVSSSLISDFFGVNFKLSSRIDDFRTGDFFKSLAICGSRIFRLGCLKKCLTTLQSNSGTFYIVALYQINLRKSMQLT